MVPKGSMLAKVPKGPRLAKCTYRCKVGKRCLKVQGLQMVSRSKVGKMYLKFKCWHNATKGPRLAKGT